MSPTRRPDTSLIRSAVVARIVTTSPHDWSLPASTARATSCSRMATLESEATRCGRFGVAGRTADRAATGSVRCRVARDDAVANRLVEHQDQRGDRVLDRRPAELGLPLVDGAVDQAGGDHRDRKMTERWKDATTETGRVWVIGRGRVDSS